MEASSVVKTVSIPNGETLAYREAGNSSTVLLFLHGAYVTSYFWISFFPELSKTFKVIAPDFRGHGGSTYNNPLKHHDDIAQDIKMFVDALGLKKFFIIGWSTGGGVAMNFAVKHPEYVEGIILHNSIGAQGYPIFKKGPNGRPTPERVTTEEGISNHPDIKLLAQIIYQKDKERMRALNELTMYNARTQPSDDQFEKELNEMFKCRCVETVVHINNIFNISGEDNPAAKGTNEISKIKCKVLILHGEKDLVVRKKVAEKNKELLGDLAILKIFPDAGHSVMNDYPEEFLNIVKRFCAKSSQDYWKELSKL